ncbi:MAG: tetratricopeptide repeat protein [Nitrospirae bacterium]|uniref:tetratricopeptide repeat protein n=1 Tax=Candidatus Magnetobacterium casense TaxID=1455061 RepID=UPI00058B09A9|nr:tetratricopeptide repeat protein [Candidatus Magnetobacterium casensis]MBF0338804.1 tetratricopeptide repeat protein [Nitrospirota bacterium]
MSPKKLEKLKEQVFQKADSKLYIPLAEEYKKINMTEDAVKVLKYCISKHPNYMSARVALGKIYMEEGYVANAIEEFEKVVVAIPDNLLAHKKLAQLYMSTGNTTGALASLEKILILNPNDEQAQESIRDLKAQPQDEEVATQRLTDESQDEEVTTDLITASDSGDTTTDIEQDPDTEDLDAQAGIELLKQVEQEIPMTPLQQQLHDIDQYIESERFLVAVMAYNTLLKEYPDSNEIKQRRMEAIRYARLLKKDETVLIHKLDTFCKKLKEYNKA